MEVEKRFRVYLDHNVLDSIIKGDRFGVKHLLDAPAFLPVYSDENLKEISSSRGYEDQFLAALKSVKAWYLVALTDEAFLPTGRARITEADPFEACVGLMQTLAEAPKGDGGLSRLLKKSYGGLGDTSYREILAQGADDVEESLQSAFQAMEASGPLDPVQLDLLKQLKEMVPIVYSEAMHGVANQLEEYCPDSMMQTVQNGLGMSPLDLNNIRAPGVVKQVWEKAKEAVPGAGFNLEDFFGLKGSPWCIDREREPTIPEKVNAICHQLNFLGYFRDTGMKEEKGLKRSFADMTHAGMAFFCHLLLTSDRRMFMKAIAAYEYLDVGPQVHLLTSNGHEQAGPWLRHKETLTP
jgi:hypothetical protein